MMNNSSFKAVKGISIIFLVIFLMYSAVMADGQDQTATIAPAQQKDNITAANQPIGEAVLKVKPEQQQKKLYTKTIRRPVRSAFDVLEKTRISVDYDEMSFRDIVRDLREQLGINIVVFWPELRGAGYSMDDQISLHLNNVVAEQVFASMLDYLSGGYGDKIGFQVDRNVLTIRLKENIEKIHRVKAYYVADLLQQPSRIDNSRFFGGNMGMSGYSGGFGGGNQFRPGQMSWGSGMNGMNMNMQGWNMNRPSGNRPGVGVGR